MKLKHKLFGHFLTKEQTQMFLDYYKDKLADKKMCKPALFCAREIEELLFIEWHQAMAIIMILSALGMVDTDLKISHMCSSDLYSIAPFKDGYPSVPYYCTHCKMHVFDILELRLDIIANIKEQ